MSTLQEKYKPKSVQVLAALAFFVGNVAHAAAQPAAAPSSLYMDTTVDKPISGPITRERASGADSKTQITESPKHGEAALRKSFQGGWIYTPSHGFTGYDEFLIQSAGGHVTRVVVMVCAAPTRKTYYVDALHGSDKNAGSRESPLATIQAAQNVTCSRRYGLDPERDVRRDFQ